MAIVFLPLLPDEIGSTGAIVTVREMDVESQTKAFLHLREVGTVGVTGAVDANGPVIGGDHLRDEWEVGSGDDYGACTMRPLTYSAWTTREAA